MAIERWLVTGASGQLGSHVLRLLAAEATPMVRVLGLAGRSDLEQAKIEVRRVDLADAAALRDMVAAVKPTHVLHLGAMTAVAECAARPARAVRVNVDATRVLAQAAAPARFVFSSTDMVFDGEHAPYRESDPPQPVSCYGRTKAAAEAVLTGLDQTLVVRLPLMYGFPRHTRPTTFVKQMTALRCGEPLRLFEDEYRTPAWLGDAARALIGLARSARTGLIHVPGPERLSRYELIARCAALLDLREAKLERASRLDVQSAEPRPRDLSLDGSRLRKLCPELSPGPVRMEALQE